MMVVRTTAGLEFRVPSMVIEKLPVGVPVGDKVPERQPPSSRSSASIRPATSLGRGSHRPYRLAAAAGEARASDLLRASAEGATVYIRWQRGQASGHPGGGSAKGRRGPLAR